MNDKKFARLMKRDGIDEATVLCVRIRFGNLLAEKTYAPGPARKILSDTMVNWCLDDARGDLDQIMSPKLLKWIARSTVMDFCMLSEKFGAMHFEELPLVDRVSQPKKRGA